MNDGDIKRFINSKQSKITRGQGTPSNLEGSDGELTIRHIAGQGIFLFYKWGGRWYSSRFSLYVRTTHERKEPVYLPKGRKPKSIGELTLDTDNKVKLRKSSSINQVISSDKDKVLDINEIQTSRTSIEGMGTDTAGTADFKILNTTGHTYLHLQTKGSDYDPYIIYSYLTAGESVVLKQWVVGMDNSDSDTFKWCSQTSGTEPVTPSKTAALNMSLSTTGNLTTEGTISAKTVQEIGSDTDKFLMLDTHEIKYVDGATLRGYIGAGTSSVGALDDLSDVTYSSGDLTITSLDKIVSSGDLTFEIGGDMILDATGDLSVTGMHIEMENGRRLYFDGGDNTYIIHPTSDKLDFYVGGVKMMQFIEGDSNTANFLVSAVGFTQEEPTFNATDTIITFSTTGNKAKLTLTDNCADIHFKFPAVSGNFVCVLLQDGTGGRTISNWKTQDEDGNAGNGNSGLVLWAGGTAPTNTETADKADIVSFYWDADNEIAYGTYTYNF